MPEGPVEMLLGCHARIRHFMQLSSTLACAVEAPPREIADAAAAVFRYFSEALPLHEADENKTLFPRVLAAQPFGGLVREAAETMVAQHEAIDELAAELLTLCSSLSRQPERLPLVANRLQEVCDALGLIFDSHLQLEETVIFPALAELLTASQIQEMSREMYARRQPHDGKLHIVD